jgi:signal-transduction protein with cAMP-binding, CBS, and nucleotidyltransferase domain
MLSPEDKEMQALSEVADYMARSVKSVPPETTIQEAGQVMAKFNIGSLLVVKEGEYAGIITETDLARKGMAKGINPEKTTVQALMSSPILSIESHKTVEEAHALMKAKGIRHLGVTEAGKIVGLVSLSDLIRYYTSYFQMSE